MKFMHEWKWDWPWHMVYWRDWFYMVNYGYIYPNYFLHVRFFGLRSVWVVTTDDDESTTLRYTKFVSGQTEEL